MYESVKDDDLSNINTSAEYIRFINTVQEMVFNGTAKNDSSIYYSIVYNHIHTSADGKNNTK